MTVVSFHLVFNRGVDCDRGERSSASHRNYTRRLLPARQSLQSKKMLGRGLLLVMIIMTAFTVTKSDPADNNPHCIKNSRTCVRNDECCGGCCAGGKCVSYADTCIQAQSPCASHQCPAGQSCYLQQVQCIQAPCPPIPACKSDDYDEDY